MKKNMVPLILSFAIIILGIGCSNNLLSSVQQPPPVKKEFYAAGSGSAVPIMRKLSERYNQEYGENIQIPDGISSNGGMEAVKNGAVDLGLTARPQLTEAEKKMGLVQLVFARIGVIVGVNPTVTENDLSGQQLADIYSARKTEWQNNQKIVVLLKEDGDSSNKVLADNIPGFKQALDEAYVKKRWQICYSGTTCMKTLAKTPYSIGVIDTGLMTVYKPKIKALSINGIAPSISNIKSGKYVLHKDLNFVYKTPLSDRANKFIQWVYSEEGQQIITESGGIPVNAE